MLEVINGFLMIYFVSISLLNILLPALVKPIATCFTRPSNAERNIWAEIISLKMEQKKISMKDEFAAYSKLQRKINKLESQLKDDSQSRMYRSTAIKNSFQVILQAFLALVTILSVFHFRREPIVALNASLFPLTAMFSYPSNMPNAISTHVWVLFTNVTFNALLKPLVS